MFSHIICYRIHFWSIKVFISVRFRCTRQAEYRSTFNNRQADKDEWLSDRMSAISFYEFIDRSRVSDQSSCF